MSLHIPSGDDVAFQSFLDDFLVEARGSGKRKCLISRVTKSRRFKWRKSKAA